MKDKINEEESVISEPIKKYKKSKRNNIDIIQQNTKGFKEI